jgi:hypothetical protein
VPEPSSSDAFGEMKNAAADVLYQLMLTRNPVVNGSTPKHSKNLASPDFRGEAALR